MKKYIFSQVLGRSLRFAQSDNEGMILPGHRLVITVPREQILAYVESFCRPTPVSPPLAGAGIFIFVGYFSRLTAKISNKIVFWFTHGHGIMRPCIS